MQHVGHMVMVIIGLQLSLASSLGAFAVRDIAVHSRRGEPFAADIRLLLEARERDQEIEVTLGDQEAYRGEGFKRLAVLDTLKATLPPGTRDVIRLSSTVPLQEAPFDLVLLVRMGHVTIVKHYAVDLPAPASIAAPMAASLPIIASVAPVSSARKAGPKAMRPPQRRERYGPIQQGETLYSVVKSLRVPNDKLWQAVVVLWRANKEQFHGGNLHGLPAGTFLAVPPDLAGSTAALRLAEAQEIVAEQWEEWRALQRAGLSKQRVMVEAHDTEISATGSAKPEPTIAEAAKREVTTAAEQAQEVVLPVGKAENMVNMAELQTVLQGLEERLMRRLTPTGQPPELRPGQAEAQEARMTPALVSASELQASIQSLEERLTQRMQQMMSQTPEPVRLGPWSPQQVFARAPSPLVVEAVQPLSLLMVPYLLVATNVLLLLLVGALVWLWLRRRDRVERMQRI
jgi:Tfp pilus assembly protein FimV